MQQLAEPDAPTDRDDVRPSRRRKASPRRKVTVRLSEGVCGRLDVATDQPGIAKSMLVEAALEHFLNPIPSVEDLLRDRLDDMHARFDHLERDMRTIAETVALHARYHLTVVPPLPESRHRAAIVLGDERFRVLAEQVDRRVRERRPLIQETIARLRSAERQEVEPTTDGGPIWSPPGRIQMPALNVLSSNRRRLHRPRWLAAIQTLYNIGKQQPIRPIPLRMEGLTRKLRETPIQHRHRRS